MAVTGGAPQTNPAFRQTTAGAKLGQALFRPDLNILMTPSMISSLLTAAGVPVPKAVTITADSAQIIMAGGAIADGIETAADIGAFINPFSSIIHATEDILSTLGLMDSNSPGAQMVEFGTDLILVIATGGVNLVADLMLVMDIVKQVFNFFPPDLTGQCQAYATALANQKLNALINAREGSMQRAAAVDFANYQNGKIQLLQLMKNVAGDAPDLFENYFPDVSVFLPPSAFGVVTLTATASYSKTQKYGFFDLMTKVYNVSETVSRDLRTLIATPAQIGQAVYDRFVNAPLLPYKFIDQAAGGQMFPLDKRGQYIQHRNPVRRMNVLNWVALSLFPPYVNQIDPSFDVRPLLASLMLTPSDLGDDMIGYEMEHGYWGQLSPTAAAIDRTPAVSFNGVEQFTPAQNQVKAYQATYSKETQTIIDLDKKGDILGMLKNKRAFNILGEWGILPDVPWYAFNDPSAQGAVLLKLMQQYRNIQNLFAALSMHDQLAQSPQVNAQANFGKYLNPLLFTMSDLQARHKQIQMKSVGRKMNLLAKKNVAQFFNTTPDKINMVSQQGKLSHAVVA